MEDKNVKTFTIFAKEIKKDKQVFLICSTNIGNKWYKVKFNKDCPVVAKEAGLYDCIADVDDLSLERGKDVTNKSGKVVKANDTIWIKNVLSLEHYTEEQMKERNRLIMDDVFGE